MGFKLINRLQLKLKPYIIITQTLRIISPGKVKELLLL